MSHYFDKYQETPDQTRTIEAVIRGKRFVFSTGAGTFSPTRVDPGSMLLAEESDVPEGADVLDLGCGYGAIGIAIAKTVPGTHVALVDTNARAVSYAEKNATGNGVTVKIASGDGFANLGNALFDVILFNPPFSAGKDIWLRLIADAKGHLRDGGSLQVVAPTNKGGGIVESELTKLFGKTTVLARKSGYRIYKAEKRPSC